MLTAPCCARCGLRAPRDAQVQVEATLATDDALREALRQEEECAWPAACT